MRVVTRFFEDGRSQVLVGTRGLLGEGWDARRITGLVDLTAVTTIDRRRADARAGAAHRPGVAGEGRADLVGRLRLRPAPQGRQRLGPVGAQAQRLLRRRRARATWSTGSRTSTRRSRRSRAPPSRTSTPSTRGWSCAARTARRSAPPGGWGSRTPTAVARTVRIRPTPTGASARDAAASRGRGPASRPPRARGRAPRPGMRTWTALAGDRRRRRGPAWPRIGPAGVVLAALALLNLPLLARGRGRAVRSGGARRGRASRPSIWRIASAVADALHATSLVSVGSEAVEVDLGADGEYRCLLAGVSEAESAVFATALDEALAPIGSPALRRPALGRHRPGHVAAHPPRGLRPDPRRRRGLAPRPHRPRQPTPGGPRRYGAAWGRWVGWRSRALHRLARGRGGARRAAGQRPVRRRDRDAAALDLSVLSVQPCGLIPGPVHW